MEIHWDVTTSQSQTCSLSVKKSLVCAGRSRPSARVGKFNFCQCKRLFGSGDLLCHVIPQSGKCFVCVCGNEQVVHTIRRCSVSKSNKGLPKKEVFETLTWEKCI